MSTIESIIKLTRDRENGELRTRYAAIVHAVVDRLEKSPLVTDETIAMRLTPGEVIELSRVFETLKAPPSSFETDVQALRQLRRASASRDEALARVDAARSPLDIDADIIVSETVADIVAEAARLPVVELEGERRRRDNMVRDVEYAERGVDNARWQMSSLMKDS